MVAARIAYCGSCGRATSMNAMRLSRRTLAPVKSRLERGLVELRPGPTGTRAMFTEAGWDALRQMAQDRRALDPTRYAHIRHELGLSTAEDPDC